MREVPQRELNDEDASFTSRFRGGSWWRGGTRGSGVTFDVVGVTGEETLEAVLDVCRRGEAVVFAGIDDELSGAAEALQRLVHLLTTENGNVPVYIAAHEESGGSDGVNAVEGL